MVAMVIGLVVIGAVFANYINNAAGSRQTAALAQVTSDASLALGIMRNHIAIAGYGQPSGASANGILTNFTGPAILGCDHGFADFTDATLATVSCNSAAMTPPVGNSFMVRYQTDTHISPSTTTPLASGGSATGPSDCTGATITAAGAAPLIADSRFQLHPDSTALRCWGNGQGGYQPLVDNVFAMSLRYGIGIPDTAGNGKMLRTVRYVKASEVGALTAPAWSNVMAVRICVVVRSIDAVLPSATPYRDCNGTAQTPNDRRIYRAFTSTILINNRLSSRAFDPA